MFITAYRGRTKLCDITITDEDGDNVSISGSDAIRVKIGNGKDTPLLDLDTVAATANGSSLTLANPTRLRLDQSDLSGIPAGVYDIEVSVVDNSDSQKIKHAESGTFALHDTPGGDVGLS